MLNYIKKTCQMQQTKFSFGATSAIITNLGLIIGLRSGEHVKLGIIGGILVIALADNISDSIGIHIYQESECIKPKEVWISTFTNFMTRLIVSLVFVLLVAILPIQAAVICSLIWGLSLLSVLSYSIAKREGISPYAAMLEHLAIALFVIVASNFLGHFIIHKFQL